MHSCLAEQCGVIDCDSLMYADYSYSSLWSGHVPLSVTRATLMYAIHPFIEAISQAPSLAYENRNENNTLTTAIDL